MKNPLVVAVVAGAFLIAVAIIGGAMLLKPSKEPATMTPEMRSDLDLMKNIAAGSEAAQKVAEMQSKLKLSLAANDARSLVNSLDIYFIENLTHPESLSDLKDNKISVDPWGNPYNYVRDGKTVRVWSNGPDGKPGTADDIEHKR